MCKALQGKYMLLKNTEEIQQALSLNSAERRSNTNYMVETSHCKCGERRHVVMEPGFEEE